MREGGRWTLSQRIKNDALWLLVSAAVATLGRLPPRVLRGAGEMLGRLAFAVVPSARRIADQNIALVFPGLDRRARRELAART